MDKLIALMAEPEDSDNYLIGVYKTVEGAKAKANDYADRDATRPLEWAEAEYGGIFAYDGYITYIIIPCEVGP